MSRAMGALVGVSKQTEMLLMTVLALWVNIFDMAIFEISSNLDQVWNVEIDKEMFHPNSEYVIRMLLSGVVLVRTFTLHLYIAFLIAVFWPVCFGTRPTLMLPWLVVSAIKNLGTGLVSIGTGGYTCIIYGPMRPACLRFLASQIIDLSPSFYMWIIGLSLYRDLKKPKTINRLQIKAMEDQELNVALRRRKVKSMIDEDILRQQFESRSLQKKFLGTSAVEVNEFINSCSYDSMKNKFSRSLDSLLDVLTVQTELMDIDDSEPLDIDSSSTLQQKTAKLLGISMDEIDCIKQNRQTRPDFPVYPVQHQKKTQNLSMLNSKYESPVKLLPETSLYSPNFKAIRITKSELKSPKDFQILQADYMQTVPEREVQVHDLTQDKNFVICNYANTQMAFQSKIPEFDGNVNATFEWGSAFARNSSSSKGQRRDKPKTYQDRYNRNQDRGKSMDVKIENENKYQFANSLSDKSHFLLDEHVFLFDKESILNRKQSSKKVIPNSKRKHPFDQRAFEEKHRKLNAPSVDLPLRNTRIKEDFIRKKTSDKYKTKVLIMKKLPLSENTNIPIAHLDAFNKNPTFNLDKNIFTNKANQNITISTKEENTNKKTANVSLEGLTIPFLSIKKTDKFILADREIFNQTDINPTKEKTKEMISKKLLQITKENNKPNAIVVNKPFENIFKGERIIKTELPVKEENASERHNKEEPTNKKIPDDTQVKIKCNNLFTKEATTNTNGKPKKIYIKIIRDKPVPATNLLTNVTTTNTAIAGKTGIPANLVEKEEMVGKKLSEYAIDFSKHSSIPKLISSSKINVNSNDLKTNTTEKKFKEDGTRDMRHFKDIFTAEQTSPTNKNQTKAYNATEVKQHAEKPLIKTDNYSPTNIFAKNISIILESKCKHDISKEPFKDISDDSKSMSLAKTESACKTNLFYKKSNTNTTARKNYIPTSNKNLSYKKCSEQANNEIISLMNTELTNKSKLLKITTPDKKQNVPAPQENTSDIKPLFVVKKDSGIPVFSPKVESSNNKSMKEANINTTESKHGQDTSYRTLLEIKFDSKKPILQMNTKPIINEEIRPNTLEEMHNSPITKENTSPIKLSTPTSTTSTKSNLPIMVSKTFTAERKNEVPTVKDATSCQKLLESSNQKDYKSTENSIKSTASIKIESPNKSNHILKEAKSNSMREKQNTPTKEEIASKVIPLSKIEIETSHSIAEQNSPVAIEDKDSKNTSCPSIKLVSSNIIESTHKTSIPVIKENNYCKEISQCTVTLNSSTKIDATNKINSPRLKESISNVKTENPIIEEENECKKTSEHINKLISSSSDILYKSNIPTIKIEKCCKGTSQHSIKLITSTKLQTINQPNLLLNEVVISNPQQTIPIKEEKYADALISKEEKVCKGTSQHNIQLISSSKSKSTDNTSVFYNATISIARKDELKFPIKEVKNCKGTSQNNIKLISSIKKEIPIKTNLGHKESLSNTKSENEINTYEKICQGTSQNNVKLISSIKKADSINTNASQEEKIFNTIRKDQIIPFIKKEKICRGTSEHYIKIISAIEEDSTDKEKSCDKQSLNKDQSPIINSKEISQNNTDLPCKINEKEDTSNTLKEKVMDCNIIVDDNSKLISTSRTNFFVKRNSKTSNTKDSLHTIEEHTGYKTQYNEETTVNLFIKENVTNTNEENLNTQTFNEEKESKKQIDADKSTSITKPENPQKLNDIASDCLEKINCKKCLNQTNLSPKSSEQITGDEDIFVYHNQALANKRSSEILTSLIDKVENSIKLQTLQNTEDIFDNEEQENKTKVTKHVKYPNNLIDFGCQTSTLSKKILEGNLKEISKNAAKCKSKTNSLECMSAKNSYHALNIQKLTLAFSSYRNIPRSKKADEDSIKACSSSILKLHSPRLPSSYMSIHKQRLEKAKSLDSDMNKNNVIQNCVFLEDGYSRLFNLFGVKNERMDLERPPKNDFSHNF